MSSLIGMSEYGRPLLESEIDPDPLRQFSRWFAEAAKVVRTPEAIVVASASLDGRPSVRMVLLKDWDERGFVFYTNYASQKAVELDANPWAALLAHWDPLGRQVRIEGSVRRVDPAESDEYFRERPRGAQIGAHASHQSQPIGSRTELEVLVERLTRELAGREVTRPEHWGGYRIEPESFEFWQHREDRLHDRLIYRIGPEGWRIGRLQP